MKYVVANWKMYCGISEAQKLVLEIKNGLRQTDYKNVMVSDRDENGKPTGEKKIIHKWFETGKKIWGAANNYLAYLQFKKDRWAKYDAKEYAKKINIPPVADEYYN